MESFHVRSDIRYRFATTQMSSVVRNVDSKAQEIGFDVTLPKNAFIMAFHMSIDGKRYDGQVKERKQAKREYQAAVDRGQSAGHVRQAPRHANVFEVAVNVAAGSAVNFTLTYQEVLRRRIGIYEHEIHVNPGQPVEDFRIEVHIRENRPLKFVRTPALRKDVLLTNLVGDVGRESENGMTLLKRPSPETATILYTPSLKEQGGKSGISARFAVQYDVEHAGPKGDVIVVDGYFVHFLSPDTVRNTLPKDIIFVLDVSGSMYGRKIRQLQAAMTTILSDLKPKDRFNIITFSSDSSKWKADLVQADENNVVQAKSYVRGMQANGMTNINAALLTALSEMNLRHDKERAGMIFFLTDGLPTAGVTDSDRIAQNVLRTSERTVAIFSLAFGDGADYKALKSLSAQNLGFARKIYEASDSDLQVSSLYDEISAVSMKDMSIKYQNSSVDEFSLTKTEFPIVFKGTEIMICGFLRKDTKSLKYEITGSDSEGEIDIMAEVDTEDAVLIGPEEETDKLFTGPRDFSGMMERMWAYQTIRQLLRNKVKHSGDSGKVKQLEKKILEMSLKYTFVTPLTSMIVSKPDKGETEMREAKFENAGINASQSLRSFAVAPPGPVSTRQAKQFIASRGRYPSSGFHPRRSGGPPQSYPSYQVPLFDPSLMHGLNHDPIPAAHMPSSRPTATLRRFSTTIPSSTWAPSSTTTPTSSTAATSTTTPTSTPSSTISTTPASTKTPTRPTTSTRTSSSKTRMTTAHTSSTSSTNNPTTTSEAPPLTRPSFLKLVTVSLDLNSQPPPVICMVPRQWKYGNIILVSETNASSVVLTQCSRRECPNTPSIKSLQFISGRAVADIRLDGSPVWRYSNSSAFKVYEHVQSNSDLLVIGPGFSATIERAQEGQAVGYKVHLTVQIKGNPGNGYSGLLGKMLFLPAKLKMLDNKQARDVCRNEGSRFSVLVSNKHARKHSVYRTRKNGRRRKSFSFSS